MWWQSSIVGHFVCPQLPKKGHFNFKTRVFHILADLLNLQLLLTFQLTLLLRTSFGGLVDCGYVCVCI